MRGFWNAPTHGTPVLLDGPIYTDARSRSERRAWPFRQTQEKGASTETDFPAMPMNSPGDDASTPQNHVHRTPTWTIPLNLNTFTHTFALLSFGLPVVALALVLKIPSWCEAQTSRWASAFTHCDFKGHFTPYNEPSISLWDKSGVFYINVTWGQMAFSTAKFIDIVWDFAVGRAGQAFVAWVTYRVSSRYLAAAMREAPVSYTTYVALAFVPPNLTRTARLAGELLTNRGWRARLIMVWIVLSSLFVLSFSSLLTTMSGYGSNSEAIMSNYGGQAVPWDKYQVVQFAIKDAWRIGEPGPVAITVGEACAQQGIEEDGSIEGSYSYQLRDDQGGDGNGEDSDEQPWPYVPSNCTMFWRTVQYVHSYGLHGTQKESSTFTWNGLTHKLSAPTLNITTSYTPSSLSKLAGYLEHSSSQSPLAPKDVNKISEATFWTYENETYSLAYVLNHARCQYDGRHNWGFSFLLLFITSLLLAIWAVGTYALWLHVHLKNPSNSHHHPRNRHLLSEPRGIYRSSWDLVNAMKKDLGPDAVSPEMTEKHIRGLVRRRPGVGLMAVGVEDAGQEQQMTQVSTGVGANTARDVLGSASDRQSGWDVVRSRLVPYRLYPLTGQENEQPMTGDPTRSAFSLSSQTPILAPSPTALSLSSSILYQPSTPSTARADFDGQTPTDMMFKPDVVVPPADHNFDSTRSPSFRPRLSKLISSSNSIVKAHTSVPVPGSDRHRGEQKVWQFPSSSSTEATPNSAVESPSQAIGRDTWKREFKTTRAQAGLDAITFRNDLGDD